MTHYTIIIQHAYSVGTPSEAVQALHAKTILAGDFYSDSKKNPILPYPLLLHRHYHIDGTYTREIISKPRYIVAFWLPKDAEMNISQPMQNVDLPCLQYMPEITLPSVSTKFKHRLSLPEQYIPIDELLKEYPRYDYHNDGLIKHPIQLQQDGYTIFTLNFVSRRNWFVVEEYVPGNDTYPV